MTVSIIPYIAYYINMLSVRKIAIAANIPLAFTVYLRVYRPATSSCASKTKKKF